MLSRRYLKYAVCAALAISAFGATAGWKPLSDQALKEASSGCFAQAEASLRSAIAALPDPASLEAVLLWNQFAALHHETGELSASDIDSERALAINANLVSPDEVQQAIALNNLAITAEQHQQDRKTEQLLREAYRHLEHAGRLNGKTAALVKGNLAFALQRQSRFVEAGTLYEEAAGQLQSLAGGNSPEYAHVLMHQAQFDLETGNVERSITRGKQALAVERSFAYFNAAALAGTLNNLGLALAKGGSLSSAGSVLEEALKLEAGLPNDRQQLVATLNNLAGVNEKQGRLREAKEAEARVDSLTASGGQLDDKTRSAISGNQGRIAMDEHRYPDARNLLNAACAESLSGYGAQSPQYAASLSDLASLEAAEGRHKKSEELYRQAWQIDEARLGPKHPEVAYDMSNNAAQLYYRKDHHRQALEIYEQARTIMAAAFGSSSYQVAQTWHNTAVILFADHRFEDAARADGTAVDTLATVSGGQNPVLATWLHSYSLCLREAGKIAEANMAETRALGIEVRNTVAAQRSVQTVAERASGSERSE